MHNTTTVYVNGKYVEVTFLQRHDVIRLEKGMKVYAEVPSRYFFDPFSSEKKRREVIIGKKYCRNVPSQDKITSEIYQKIHSIIPVTYGNVEEFVKGLRLDMTKDSFDSSIFEGEYEVYCAVSDGGGHTHDGGYPNGWHVFCQKKDDPEIEVDFYQTGCFTAMIPEIKPINPQVN